MNDTRNEDGMVLLYLYTESVTFHKTEISSMKVLNFQEPELKSGKLKVLI